MHAPPQAWAGTTVLTLTAPQEPLLSQPLSVNHRMSPAEGVYPSVESLAPGRLLASRAGSRTGPPRTASSDLLFNGRADAHLPSEGKGQKPNCQA